jgi:hypothetical protein
MKKLQYISLFIFINAALCAQVPEKFPYQAVVRDGHGEVIDNQPVTIRIQLLQGSQMDTVYSEMHQVKTNRFGLVVLTIGEGENDSVKIDAIDWAKGHVFVETGIKDESDGYTIMGASQLLAVPYALYAKTAENCNDSDTSTSNELQDLTLNETMLSLTKDTMQVDLAALQDGVNDQDSLSTNELIDSIVINKNNLLIYEGGEATINLGIQHIRLDADSLADNELVSDIYLSVNQLVIVEGNNKHIDSVDLTYFNQSSMNVDDADADPENELHHISRSGSLLYLTLLDDTPVNDTVSLVPFIDEYQNLSYSKSGDIGTVHIDNGGSAVFSLADADNSDTNEIQNLQEVLLLTASANSAHNLGIANVGYPQTGGDAANEYYLYEKIDFLKEVINAGYLTDFIEGTGTREILYDMSNAGLLLDERDNQIYRIRSINGTFWMLDDLDYEGVDEKGTYHESNAGWHYGKYYEESELDDICPQGWKIPVKADFDDLHMNFSAGQLIKGGSSGLDLVEAYLYAFSYGWFADNYNYWAKEHDLSDNYEIYENSYPTNSYLFKTLNSGSKVRVRCIKQ